jgi:hypothetical protein
MKKLGMGLLTAALIAFAPLANAGKLMFGTEDSIQFVASTTMQTPEGRLFLGHRVRMHAFLLPFYVESKGLVFGVSGDSKKYVPLPPEDKLATLKAPGVLPQQLPRPRLGAFDYLFGFALEWFLLGSIGYFVIKRKRSGH